ncbi:hypothetical protein ACWF62_17595 [Rhodococcus sp. NPDC054953]
MQHDIVVRGIAHTVEATEPAPGLRAYLLPEEHRVDMGYNARLGHHTGPYIARFEHITEAEAAGRLIGPLADWTKARGDLISLELGKQVTAVIEHQTHGVMGAPLTDAPSR